MKILEYIPTKRDNPKLININSAWGDIPTIILDIIQRFNIDTKLALEFGVEYGYSTSALSNYFEKVIGIDTFKGDIHSSYKKDHIEITKNYLKDYKNIKLIQSDYQNFILNNENIYDLIHIDIIHDYEHTYNCGEWSINHSKVVIFHDTESFKSVKDACIDLSKKFNLDFYNYKNSNGLGILINEKI